MEYKDQIKSPKWQKRRLEILKRDEFTCQQCGNKELTLHVHHKHYNKGAMIWDYQGWELTTLCEDCHSETHNKKEIKHPPNLDLLDYINENFSRIDIKNLYNILSSLPENFDTELESNEFLEVLSTCFNIKGFSTKLFFDINQICENYYKDINISRINDFLKQLSK